MNVATEFFFRLLENESGAVAAEYALLIAFIAMVIFTTVMGLGGKVLVLYEKAAAIFP